MLRQSSVAAVEDSMSLSEYGFGLGMIRWTQPVLLLGALALAACGDAANPSTTPTAGTTAMSPATMGASGAQASAGRSSAPPTMQPAQPRAGAPSVPAGNAGTGSPPVAGMTGSMSTTGSGTAGAGPGAAGAGGAGAMSGTLGGKLMYTDELTKGTVIPPKYKCLMSLIGGGTGENKSPPLAWTGGPAETKSFASSCTT